MTNATKTVTVINTQGLHARPADVLVKVAKQFSSTIQITKASESVDAKSILALLTLAAERGAQLEIRASGDDAPAAVEALARLFESGFDTEVDDPAGAPDA